MKPGLYYTSTEHSVKDVVGFQRHEGRRLPTVSIEASTGLDLDSKKLFIFILLFPLPSRTSSAYGSAYDECLYFIDIGSVLPLSFAVLIFMLSCVTACSTFLHFYSFRSLDVCHCVFQGFRVTE